MLLDTPVDKDRALYFVNVSTLLNTPTNSAQIHACHAGKAKAIVEKVHSLHNVLRQATSSAAMARALRFGAWINCDLLPAQVEQQVFKHQQCLSCAMDKANRWSRAEGTRIKPNPFGHSFSIDWKPVTPPSISGHIGVYDQRISSTAFEFVVMSKEHNADNTVFFAIKLF